MPCGNVSGALCDISKKFACGGIIAACYMLPEKEHKCHDNFIEMYFIT